MAFIIVNSVVWGMAYAAIALGFALIYQTSRFFHFAHAAVIAMGGYASAFVLLHWDWVWWLAVALGSGIAGLVGVALDITVYRRMRARGATDLAMFIASMGLLVLGQNTLSIAFGDAPIRIPPQSASLSLEAIGLPIQGHRVVLLIGSTVAVGALLIVAMLTRFGRVMKAVADDPELAYSIGVPVARIRSVAFALGSAVGGAVVAVMAADIDLTPSSGLQLFFVAVVVMIVGSATRAIGIVLAAFGIASLMVICGRWLPGQWQEAAVFFVLVLVLSVRSIHRTSILAPAV